MKFVIAWTIRPGSTQEAVERFLRTGDPLPEGVKTIGRWHRIDLQSGIHLVESNDSRALAQYAAQWTDVLELETYAVVEDADAIDAYRKITGVEALANAKAGQRI
ncbi:MAG TPA: DUF3303 family protein [Bryobacteraceae bacterium]|jgi:hypothetical protein